MEILANYFDLILNYLVYLVEKFGYSGIFIGMFLESTFVPIPSEIIMLPAGVSAAYGNMNIFIAITVGVTGNLLGALFFMRLFWSDSFIKNRQIFFHQRKNHR
jgi:membrane protein DedA with SNARE-associated domain